MNDLKWGEIMKFAIVALISLCLTFNSFGQYQARDIFVIDCIENSDEWGFDLSYEYTRSIDTLKVTKLVIRGDAGGWAIWGETFSPTGEYPFEFESVKYNNLFRSFSSRYYSKTTEHNVYAYGRGYQKVFSTFQDPLKISIDAYLKGQKVNLRGGAGYLERGSSYISMKCSISDKK